VKKLAGIALGALMVFTVAGCFSHDSDVVSQNLSYEADKFNIPRRVVFYNGITDTYMLTIEGLCALGNSDGPKELTVICKTGPTSYKKHFLGLSDNVTYFVEQLDAANASTDKYKVVFKPLTIIPDIEVK
jgi:hypothetical protein